MAVLRRPDSLAHRLFGRPCKALGAGLLDLPGDLSDAGSPHRFTLALLGRDDIALYGNSLSQRVRDPALPMETG